MRYIEDEGRIVWSASDLKAAAECEFAWLRAIDAKAGRVPAVADPEDATLERAGRLGTAHERRVLDAYRNHLGDGVIEIAETRSSDAAGLADAVRDTERALRDPATRVVYQAAFATEEFVGFADFLLRDDDGRWVVQDSKLARHARVTALMQLAAYADQLDRLGIPRADRVELLLGDGTMSTHAVDDLMPVFRLRRDRLRALVADRDLAQGSTHPAIAWGDGRGELGVVACGRCATCDQEVVAFRDLLLVAGMRPVQRERLRDAGILTIDALAAASTPPARMSGETFGMLRTQARLQLESPAGIPGLHEPSASPAVPVYQVVFPKGLGALPRPDLGDLFFDFEGDPLYTEGLARDWGIDYLFGWVDIREEYSALWAHSFAEEKVALERFLDIVQAVRREHPDMHIYHYAPYEPTHLLAMAARHGVREAEVDALLRDGVFVDLYPIVRRALKVGSRSYSIKKLEPLYMGAEVRTSDVQRGDDSIVKYVEARALAAEGREVAAQTVLDDLADYNRYDCVSTRRLRDWLVERARESGLRPSRDIESVEVAYEAKPQAEQLRALADAAEAAGGTEADVEALRLGAAAIDYYPREAKAFWAMHFLRLREPLSVWEDTRDVVVVDAAGSGVVEQWEPGPRSIRRIVRLRGEVAPGTRLTEGSRPFALYETPAPFSVPSMTRWVHVAREVEVLEVLDDGAVVAETAMDGQTWSELPVALAPAAPPRAGNQQTAIEEWADALIAAAPALPADPATDILRRRPPRTRSGALPGGRAEDHIGAITAALLDLDRSHLSVQGPPGTGKTYIGSHVIAALVREHHWKVGVVAQSHAVVEHMLDQVVDAGVPAAQVGKARKAGADGDVSFTVFPKNGLARYTEEHAETGFVVGGTAWDFSHPGRVPRRSLDLLVIDEAGQFSLASTIAVATASDRLLLLGDPQQLPQVSQGIHPEPVDASALGWVMDGASVIPPELGHFLDRSWRMHPDVARAVSLLSYDGELASHPCAALRRLDGVAPGVHPVAVRHHGNATQSPEEAAEVVRIVRDLLGRAWVDADGEQARQPRPLTQADIIVVTPYNAQQVMVEQALAEAGFADIPVGTVDRFQGQEAVVSIVSLAASSGKDAPRGLEFLLLQNRLNVAISRAKVAAFLVYAPGLLDDLPRTPDGVARLSAFARLVGVE
ncbi:TM0106 family RecB-like putative nuclease [Microbacterium sp. SYP-A9085]|uniref:TM0106 family RecB-like putative nuclease n=1 Tax=Microbacterium sp. SYP-A9085 TaxID=2664454 RepID=UPI0013285EB6|nr:TM0106 family RecB-like putative nuclease [Microbacterium sp. SYP-A9085]